MACVVLLNPSGIRQDERAEIPRAGSAEDTPAKAAGDEPGQVSAVVKMRVREHHGIDAVGIDRQRRPVSLAQLFGALEQTAVHENVTAARFEQMLRPGDCPGGTKERKGSHSMTILEE